MNFDFSDITKQLDQLQAQIEPPAPDVYIGDEFIKSNAFQQQQLEIMKKQQKILEEMKTDAENESIFVREEAALAHEEATFARNEATFARNEATFARDEAKHNRKINYIIVVLTFIACCATVFSTLLGLGVI